MFDLLRAVEDQGGTHLDDMCSAKTHIFTIQDTGEERETVLPGCGNLLMFEVPFVHALDGTNAAVVDSLRMCGLCDNMPGMPRFKPYIRGLR